MKSTNETVSLASPLGLTRPIANLDDAFMQWCRLNKVKHPKCTISSLQNTGRCVLATSHIESGEVVVEVPDDAVLMADNSSIAEVLEDWGLCKPAADPVLEIQGLIIALMHEKSLGSSSRWSGYLHWFPPTIDHLPMSWTEEELTELRGTAALDKMEGVVQQPADAPTRVKELWHEVALPFIRENPDLLIPGSVPTSTKKKGGNLRGSTNQSKAVHAEEEGYRLYMWATGIVSSYSFVLGDDKFQALVPFWDALNHITGLKNVRLHHDKKRNVLQMVATRNIHPGEEVVNDYGPLSNSELLRAYGFVERLPLPPAAADGSIRGGLENRFREASVPGNCHSHVQIPLDIVVKACCKEPGQEEEKEEVGTRCRFLRRHKICPRDGVFKVYHNDFQSCWTAVPDEGSRFYALTECIRILLLPRDSFESFHSYIDGWRVPMAIPLSTSSTSSNGMTLSGTSILQAYERIVEAMSQRYPSTLDKDLSLLTSGGISTLDARKQSSIMARVDERAVLALLGVWAQSDSRDQVEGHCQKAWASSSRLALKRKAEDCDSDESEEGDLDGDEGEGKEKEEELGAEREVERIEKAMAPFSFNFII